MLGGPHCVIRIINDIDHDVLWLLSLMIFRKKVEKALGIRRFSSHHITLHTHAAKKYKTIL